VNSPQVNLILARNALGQFALWACGGAGMGCNRNRYRQQKAPCNDCLGPLAEDLTIGEVEEHIRKLAASGKT
jgi:hypothetical protein